MGFPTLALCTSFYPKPPHSKCRTYQSRLAPPPVLAPPLRIGLPLR